MYFQIGLGWFASLVKSDMVIYSFFFPSNQEGSAFDFGELEEAIVLQGVKIRNDEAKARMLLSLSIFSPFVTCDRNNQLLKAKRERERFEYVYRKAQ